MYSPVVGVALMGVVIALVVLLIWRRVWWYVQWRRHPSVASPTRFAVWHTLGPARRLYHTSDDPRTAKAHFYANNAPRGTTVELYDRGMFRGRRVLT